MNFDITTPTTKTELLKAIKSTKNFRFGAGYTDLLMEFKKNPPKDLTVINLAQLNDKHFSSITKTKTQIRIGAMVTASEIISDKFIHDKFPVLHHAANNLASTQIRNVATIGGNLCTASPSGDVACALMALNATCEILSTTNKIRKVNTKDFFIGVRKTVLKKNEILQSITIPLNQKGKIHSGFIKIGTRLSMECSVISLAYHVVFDNKQKIKSAGFAIGSSAPTIRFTQTASDYIIGKKVDEIDKELLAQKILTYASPISDIRGSAWYRKEVLFNISKNLFENL